MSEIPLSPRIARRMAHIEPFHVMELLATARRMEHEGRDIVHMEIGEPDFTTPEPIIRAAQDALSRGLTHYTPATGLLALREKVAAYYAQRYKASVEPDQIVITLGASGALLLALATVVNSDEQVMMSDPGYPCNRNFVRLLGAEPLSVPVQAESGFQLNAALMRRYWTHKTVAALVASPANPTGSVVTADELINMSQYIDSVAGYLLMDEIYQGLCYETAAASAVGISSRVFLINSFSKYFCMTGWRLGWLVVPPGFQRAVDILAQNIFLAPSTVAQYAALSAFDDDTTQILEQRRDMFRQRRDWLKPALEALGFVIAAEPAGAFYLYADCSGVAKDSYRFCHDLLQRAGVAVTPGIDFGQFRAEAHVRFAYTTSLERLQEGVSRIAAYLQRR